MKISKKIVIPVVAVAVIGGAAAFFVPRIVSASSNKATTVSAAPLAKMDIENTVSVTGTVKSKDATNVYSTLSYQVKLVNVEVGDRVSEGDVLCEIDTSDLKAKIDQQTVSISQSQAKAQHNLAVAKNDLATEQFNQENNYDAEITKAENAVDDARQALETAQLNLRDEELYLSAKRKDLSDYRGGAMEEYDYDPKEYDENYVTKRLAVQQSEIRVNKLENAVEEAKQSIEDAKANLNTVKVQKQEAIIKSEQQVTTAQINANLTEQQMQLEELKKDLDDAVVKAPVSGTVTAVMATEGASGQGLLFIIEDIENLKIDTKIKEYDIASVATGQKVKVKSDATGDNEFIGKVSKIAPTAVKDAKGETQDTTDVEFVVEIDVSGTSGLKIGMNARMEIVTDEKTEVFAVPYDAVVQNDEGEQVVYVARPHLAAGGEDGGNTGNSANEPQDAGTPDTEAVQGASDSNGGNNNNGGNDRSANIGYTAVMIPVQTGLETDFYIEVSSDLLNEGDLIISDPSELTDGMAVSLSEGTGLSGSGNRRGGPGGGADVRVGG